MANKNGSERKQRSDKGGLRSPHCPARFCNVCHARFAAPLVRLKDCIVDEGGQVGYIEVRPTGGQFKLQPWLYCWRCWERHIEICAAPFDEEKFAHALLATADPIKRQLKH